MIVPKIKICGLQSTEVIKSIEELSLDYIGFVFAPSRRRVTMEQASALAAAVPAGIKKVGVFVNPADEALHAIISRSLIDVIQLHGNESFERCSEIKNKFSCSLWKALKVGKDDLALWACQLARSPQTVDAILLDSFSPGQEGGTGKTFSWEKARAFRFELRKKNIPVFVAGGINAGNVLELIRQMTPDGVDVSSGVETDGAKDIDKIRQFVERVRSHE
jgi:phosphoribosylanthranilate isomerase